MQNYNLLQNPEFIKWCYEGITKETLATTSSVNKLKLYVDEENLWGNKLIGAEKNNQWTTVLCQEAVREVLTKLGYMNVRNSRKFKSTVRNKGYNPDLECDQFVWEVKGRNWTTTGTAGEKILGTPLKYSEIPKLYGKPLKIVLVGYQEYEGKNGFACGDLVDKSGGRTEELEEILAFYKTKDIEYIAFTDLLKKVNN